MSKLIKILMAVMVMLSSTVFVSCGDDDDEITNSENKPVGKIKVYSATISEVYLDLYDITLFIYSKGESAKVTLEKSDGEKEDHKYVKDGEETPYSVFNFVCDRINEHYIGIDSVKAMVIPKENIEEIINGMQNKRIVFVSNAMHIDAVYSATGKYPALNASSQTSASSGMSQALLNEKNNVKMYESQAKLLTMDLTKD